MLLVLSGTLWPGNVSEDGQVPNRLCCLLFPLMLEAERLIEGKRAFVKGDTLSRLSYFGPSLLAYERQESCLPGAPTNHFFEMKMHNFSALSSAGSLNSITCH